MSDDAIVYTSNDFGVDGREPEKVVQAAFSQDGLDRIKKADKNLAWRSDRKLIVDVELRRRTALAKLDGIDRLVLDLPQRFTEEEK